MKTVAEHFADLMLFVSNRIEDAKASQTEKSELLPQNIVWNAAADWIFINGQ